MVTDLKTSSGALSLTLAGQAVARRSGAGGQARPGQARAEGRGPWPDRIWCQVVQLACELLAWTQMLGFAEHPARRWEPKKLRLRLFSTAGRLARHARGLVLHLAADRAWTELVLAGRAAITGPTPRPG